MEQKINAVLQKNEHLLLVNKRRIKQLITDLAVQCGTSDNPLNEELYKDYISFLNLYNIKDDLSNYPNHFKVWITKYNIGQFKEYISREYFDIIKNDPDYCFYFEKLPTMEFNFDETKEVRILAEKDKIRDTVNWMGSILDAYINKEAWPGGCRKDYEYIKELLK